MADAAAAAPPPAAWRRHTTWSKEHRDALLHALAASKPASSVQPTHDSAKVAAPVNVALFGVPGVGKSSLLHSLNMTRLGRVGFLTSVGTGATTLTEKLRRLWLFPPVVLWDTAGATNANYKDDSFFYDAFLSGRVRTGENLRNKLDRSKILEAQDMSKWAHCLVIVVNGPTWDKDSHKPHLDPMREEARLRDMPVFVAMTGADVLSRDAGGGTSAVNTSAAVKQMVDQIAQDLGLLPQFVFPVCNYRAEYQTNWENDVLLLELLTCAVNCATDYRDLYSSRESDMRAPLPSESDA